MMPARRKNRVRFTAVIWRHEVGAGWCFVSLPVEDAQRIRKGFGELARGWGSLHVQATLGSARWNTSIFPDSKRGTYVLPIKAEVRREAAVGPDDEVTIDLEITARDD
jgi:hypothetical protein